MIPTKTELGIIKLVELHGLDRFWYLKQIGLPYAFLVLKGSVLAQPISFSDTGRFVELNNQSTGDKEASAKLNSTHFTKMRGSKAKAVTAADVSGRSGKGEQLMREEPSAQCRSGLVTDLTNCKVII